MLNQCVLVGRLKELKDNTLTIAVSRPFKDKDGTYGIDIVKVEIFGTLLSNTKEYCQKGDIIGVKGRIGEHNKIIAEKITFLSSRKEKE